MYSAKDCSLFIKTSCLELKPSPILSCFISCSIFGMSQATMQNTQSEDAFAPTQIVSDFSEGFDDLERALFEDTPPSSPKHNESTVPITDDIRPAAVEVNMLGVRNSC